jgi:hypothetical protein
MAKISQRRILLIGALVILSASDAAAERTLVSLDGLTAVSDSDAICTPALQVTVRAPDAQSFRGDRPVLQKLVAGVRAMVGFECPGATAPKRLLIIGEVEGARVYQGVASRDGDWALVDAGAPQAKEAAAASRQPKPNPKIDAALKKVSVLQHNDRGLALKAKGDIEGAIREYRLALEVDPGDATTHYNLGNALSDNGDLDAAIRSYRQALENDRTLTKAQVRLDRALRRKNEANAQEARREPRVSKPAQAQGQEPASPPTPVAKARAAGSATLSGRLAEDRSRMEKLGTGLPALRGGAVWYKEFEARYTRYRGDPAVVKLERDFVERRERCRADAKPELTALVQKATSNQALNAIFWLYLPLKSDEQSPVAQALVKVAEQRSADLERAAAQGAFPDPTEPTEGEMYAALKVLFDEYNQEMKDIEPLCGMRLREKNPFVALKCLQMKNGHVRAELSDFRKLRCTKTARSEFECQYAMSITTIGVDELPWLQEMMKQGDTGEKRFLRKGAAWLALPSESAENARRSDEEDRRIREERRQNDLDLFRDGVLLQGR